MVSGIGSYAADQLNSYLVMQSKSTLDNLLQQVTSGKKSLNFTGIADVSQQTLNFGNQISSTSNFLTNNTVVNLRLQGMNQVYSSVKSEMSTFQQNLENYIDNSKGTNGDAQDLLTLQQQAFAALKNMQYYLNTQVNGQYIFSGSKTDTPPVSFDFSNLAQFQAAFDGYNTQVGTTSAADLSQVSTTVLNTGSLSFNSQNGTISAANTGQFSNLPVGSTVTLSGSAYDGSYTILSNDGTNLQVAPGFTAEGDPTASSYTPTVQITTSALASQDAGLSIKPDDVYFSPPGVLTSTTAGDFSSLQAGDSITISGAQNAANNGNFIVGGVDPTGTYIYLQRPTFTSPPDFDTSGNPDGASTVSFPAGTTTTSLTDPVNGINFNSDGTISDNVAGALLGSVPIGSYISVSGSNLAANDGTYLVTANNSGVLSVSRANQTTLNDESNAASASLSNGTATSFSPGTLNFTASSSMMTAGTAGSLAGLAVGQTVNVAGSVNNNGAFVVTATFPTPVVDEASNTNAQIADGTSNFASGTTGGITFDSTTNTISAANSGTLAGIKAGDVINVSGSGSNNGAFVVQSIDPSNSVLTLEPANTAVQVAKNISVSTSSYYQGNTATVGTEIDNNTSLSFGITAADPAFEKAMRAMALIAQGATGTAGGLDTNQSRLNAANYLISSAIDGTSTGTAPYGTEKASNLQDLTLNLNLQTQTLNTVTTQQTNFQNFLQTAVGTLTNADSTQTIVQLLDQQAALQASYQSLATVRQLSLLNYLK